MLGSLWRGLGCTILLAAGLPALAAEDHVVEPLLMREIADGVYVYQALRPGAADKRGRNR
jgi:hypothetical protein